MPRRRQSSVQRYNPKLKNMSIYVTEGGKEQVYADDHGWIGCILRFIDFVVTRIEFICTVSKSIMKSYILCKTCLQWNLGVVSSVDEPDLRYHQMSDAELLNRERTNLFYHPCQSADLICSTRESCAWTFNHGGDDSEASQATDRRNR